MSTGRYERHEKNVKQQQKRASNTVKVCFNCERMSESINDDVCNICGEELVKMSRSEFVARMTGDM
jgi:rRNA maturation endonuclease Nob1